MKPAKIASLLCIIFIILAASACGNQSNQTTASPTPASNHQEQGQVEQQTENEAQGTKSFTDAYGRTVELPARPERIVAHYFTSEVTALEGNLISTNHINAKISLTEQQLASVAEIGGDGVGVNMEAILALSPDLIIIPNFLDEEAVAKLEKIAITVVLDEAQTADRQELLNSSIRTSLPAFQNGHAYVVNQLWAQNDPLTLDWLLDEATDLLLGQSNQ